MATPAVPAAPSAQTPSQVQQIDRYVRTVDRRGPVLLAGIAAGDTTWWRLDAIMPVAVPSAPALRLGVEILYGHEAAAVPELSVEFYSFTIFPTVFYDWKLPMRSRAGDFVASIEGGLGIGIARLKVDQPFMPGNYETIRAYGMRLAAAVQYRARAGWLISFQPLGVIAPLGDPDAPPQYDVQTETAYELAILGGYQFQ